jgi:hypothetical protein
MIRLPKQSLLTVLLVAVFGYVIFEALGQPIQSMLFPVTVGIIGLALTLYQLARELLGAFTTAGAGIPAGDDAADFAASDEEKTREGRQRALEQFGWLGGLLIALWLLGFYVTVPLMVALYLLRHRERPLLVAGLAVGTALVVWGVFDKLLHLPFPRGQLFVWLGL